jgi:hypothetical protein
MVTRGAKQAFRHKENICKGRNQAGEAGRRQREGDDTREPKMRTVETTMTVIEEWRSVFGAKK